MAPDEQVSRRQLLRFLTGSGATGLAGCNFNQPSKTELPSPSKTSTISTTEAEPTETIVFTDTPTSSTPEGIVFSGGDRDAFASALETLVENPESRLVIEPDTYRFDPPDVNPPIPHFVAENLQHATIEGNGARFVMTDPRRAALYFTGGTDVTVQRLTIDFDPVPFTQGTITGLSDDKQTITLELDEGYPLLTHDIFGDPEAVSATVHTSDGQFISGIKQHGAIHIDFKSITLLDGRRFELTLGVPINTDALAVGRKMAVTARLMFCLWFRNVNQPTLKNCTVRSSAGMAVETELCDAPVIRDVTIAPPPDSDRLIGSVADGIHVYDGRTGPTIENCHLEQIGDDGIVVDSLLVAVTGLRDERTVEVGVENIRDIQPGDKLEVLTPTGVRKGVLPPVADVETQESFELQTVTFESSVTGDVKPGEFLASRATTNPKFVIRDNVVRNTIANSVRIASGPGVVESNELDGCSLHGIWLRCDTSEGFAPKRWSNDITIRNNRITRSGLNYFASRHTAGVHAVYLSPENVAVQGRPHRNIELIENEIDTSARTGVILEDTKKIRLESTTVARPNQVYDDEHGIRIENIIGGDVSGNTVSGTDENLSMFGWKERTEGVSESDNVLVIDGKSVAAQLSEWVPIAFIFNRTLAPRGEIHRAFWGTELTLYDASNEIIKRIDIGGDEERIRFESGIYEKVRQNGQWGRWFGGANKTAILNVTDVDLSEAVTLELRGKPATDGISAVVRVKGEQIDEVMFGKETIQTYRISLVSR